LLEKCKKAQKLLVRKPQENGPLEGPWRSWRKNIKGDPIEIISDDLDWTGLEYYSLEIFCEHGNEP
jgi:hypothetical protein